MTVALFPFTAVDFPGLLDPVIDVYARAFAGAPYYQDVGDTLAFEATIQRHIERPGFCGFWACDPFGKMVGFDYGYSGGPGSWWHDTVIPNLEQSVIDRWLVDYLEFVELAVVPDFQGQGIGLRLHDTLLACSRHATAVLTTAQVETPALHLYRKRGWQTIRENLLFPDDKIFRRIMAKDLVVRSPLRE
jgi:ribosomal protein S18 acetylase RimI-like enzyme